MWHRETRDCPLHPKRADCIQEEEVSGNRSVGLQFHPLPLGVADGVGTDRGAGLLGAL